MPMRSSSRLGEPKNPKGTERNSSTAAAAIKTIPAISCFFMRALRRSRIAAGSSSCASGVPAFCTAGVPPSCTGTLSFCVAGASPSCTGALSFCIAGAFCAVCALPCAAPCRGAASFNAVPCVGTASFHVAPCAGTSFGVSAPSGAPKGYFSSFMAISPFRFNLALL